MKIRIAFLITGALLAGASGTARAASQPLDPDHAPIAAVDRFSDASGTLLKRSADMRLPGPKD